MTETLPPANIETISQLLDLSDSNYRLFDMGRRIEKLSKEQFKKIELNQLPYPSPSQGHAFIAIAFWKKKSVARYLWLLKLPLDEQGLLNQGTRNHFIAIIIQALGADLSQETTKEQEDLLSANPYLFTPAQYKLASLNSKIKVDLKQEASDYFLPFLDYISEKTAWHNWQAVGVQGITDFAARINQAQHTKQLIHALPYLPNEVLIPLCGALENEVYSIELISSLLLMLTSVLKNDTESNTTSPLQTQLLRALAANSQHRHCLDFIDKLLAQSQISTEILIILSGRCWLVLANKKRLMCYLEHLVTSDDNALFVSIFRDLVAIPTIRPFILECMRAPQRSPELTKAIGQLFT